MINYLDFAKSKLKIFLIRRTRHLALKKLHVHSTAHGRRMGVKLNSKTPDFFSRPNNYDKTKHKIQENYSQIAYLHKYN